MYIPPRFTERLGPLIHQAEVAIVVVIAAAVVMAVIPPTAVAVVSAAAAVEEVGDENTIDTIISSMGESLSKLG